MAVANDYYTYRVLWSNEDKEYVGLCAEFPSLSWLDNSQEAALRGIRSVVVEVISDMDSLPPSSSYLAEYVLHPPDPLTSPSALSNVAVISVPSIMASKLFCSPYDLKYHLVSSKAVLAAPQEVSPTIAKTDNIVIKTTAFLIL